MSAEEDVLIIRKKLEKMIRTKTVEHTSATELVKALQDSPITLELIQKTKIGLTVNALRKESTNEEITTLCKSLIKTWKKLLADSNKGTKEHGTSTKESSEKIESPESVKKANKNDDANAESKTQLKEMKSEPSKDSSKRKQRKRKRKRKRRKRKASECDEKDDNRSREQDGDSSELVRLKCREMLVDALRTDDADERHVLESSVLAQSIEEYIFKEFKDTGSKYKHRVRSRVANLKDIKHPALKENVLQGVIAPERFAKMTAEQVPFSLVKGKHTKDLFELKFDLQEMASDEMKDLRARLTQEAINDHQMGMIDGTVSDLFSCEKCGSNKCTYKQVQLLCSDEPMTTFLLCYSCGYRWSFC